MNEVQTAKGLIDHCITLFKQGKFTKEDMNRELEYQKRSYPTMYRESIKIINQYKKK